MPNHPDELLLKQVEDILIKQRGYISRKPEENEPVIFLATGGLDSTIIQYIILKEWKVKIYPLFIKRGAKASEYEEISFDFFCEFFSKEFPGKYINPLKINVEIPPKQIKENFSKLDLIRQGYPMRNSILESLGVSYAVSLKLKNDIDIKEIYTGIISDDFSFKPNRILSLYMMTLLSGVNTGNWNLSVTSPVLDKYLDVSRFHTKVDIIKYAIKHKIPLEKTRSCTNGSEMPDGDCCQCITRQYAFIKAGIKDPLNYTKKLSENEIIKLKNSFLEIEKKNLSGESEEYLRNY
ncbi:MAG: 7-cyano-7-deazaguanine synthase [Candidatus Nanoarchaeia archaeon]|nr:7-cyano-7-deazaguanine synthase [Candidatus Nanoarchaeia archaeon]